MKNLLMSLALVLGGAGVLAPLAAQEPVNQAKQEDLRKLMKAMGTYDLADQILVQMIDQLKLSIPNAPDGFWKGLAEKADTGKLVEMIVPIYAKHFSHDEIKQLIVFYNTPLGKKVTETLPAITQESMVAGEQWGMALAQEVVESLPKEQQ